MFVSSLAAAVLAKESSVEVLAAAAHVFNNVQQEDRLMKISLGLAIVIRILMVGMFVASMIRGSSTSPPAGDSASPRGIGMLDEGVQQQGRLIKVFIGGLSGVILWLACSSS